jgi:hypothetical protein
VTLTSAPPSSLGDSLLSDLTARISEGGHRGVDVGGFAIEDFGLPENLMPAVTLAEIGLPIVVASNTTVSQIDDVG